MSVCLHLGIHEVLYLYLTLLTRNMILQKKNPKYFTDLRKTEIFRSKIVTYELLLVSFRNIVKRLRVVKHQGIQMVT